MSKELIITQSIRQELIQAGLEDLDIGTVYIGGFYSTDCNIIRIYDVKVLKHGTFIYYEKARNWECTEWSQYGSSNINEWNRQGYIKLNKTIQEHIEEAKKLIKGELSLAEFETNDEEINEETALINRTSKESLIAMKNAMTENKTKAELLKSFVNFEMQKKKAELESIMNQVKGIVEVWKKKIGKVMKVIDTIELYLGVNEEIFQIQEGEKAPVETPISFRQLVLFMDEEVANTDDGGLDYNDVEVFDSWLLKNENYKNILPEEKGVVVFRPRRYSKDYRSDDYIGNAMKNTANKIHTYLLIRNGDCLYRIFTEKIIILDRLFPRKTELEELLKETNGYKGKYGEEEAKEKMDDAFYSYRKRAILMQGLIDRTDILHPLPIPNLSMFNLEGTEGKINFIYDDEAALTDGRQGFKAWQKSINELIEPGSRIVVTPNWSYGDNNYMVETRGFKYYSNKYSIPKSPSTGLYEVERYQERETKFFFNRNSEETKNEIKEGNWKFLERRNERCDKYFRTLEEVHSVIKYNPGGDIYSGWGYDSHERKNRIAFRIYKNDDFVLNYDQISLDDINYYLNDRANRKHYLNMMPLLRTMKKWRLEEIEKEKDFAMLVLGELIKLYPKLNQDTLKITIDELIEWWKFKNKIKRPIDKDDAKALRMIVKEFQRNNK